MPTGKSAYEKARAERSSLLLSGDEIKLKDGDVARIRFVSTMSDFFWCYTHSQPASSRLGKTWFKDVFCSMRDGQPCPFCDSQVEEDRRAKQKFFFYVWLYGVYHIANNKDGTLKQATYIGQQFFYEPINAVKILVSGAGKEGATFKKFENWEKRYKTINDRDYDWARTGAKLETTYDLIPCEEGPQPIDPAITQKVVALPSIEIKVRELLKPIILTPISEALGPNEEGTQPATATSTASVQAALIARNAALNASIDKLGAPGPAITTPATQTQPVPITRGTTAAAAAPGTGGQPLYEELF